MFGFCYVYYMGHMAQHPHSCPWLAEQWRSSGILVTVELSLVERFHNVSL